MLNQIKVKLEELRKKLVYVKNYSSVSLAAATFPDKGRLGCEDGRSSQLFCSNSGKQSK